MLRLFEKEKIPVWSCVIPEEKKESFFLNSQKQSRPAPPLPACTSYRISIGFEEWESMYIPVIKLKMAIFGEVSPEAFCIHRPFS